MLSAARADRLRPLLDGWLAAADHAARVASDPVELVRGYRDPLDIEVAGLLCASLAYGRVDLFKPLLRGLLARMGPSPAAFCRELSDRTPRPSGAAPQRWAGLEQFVYRFNVGADIGCLLLACGDAQRIHGSLGALFARCREEAASEGTALQRFSDWLRGRDFDPVVRRLGPPRALDHLLPTPATGGACKRLNLFLRWMVRGPDAVDFGLWPVPKSELIVPLDTHLARMARNLGLTARRDLSWRTADEISRSLCLLDPDDPVKYDFALCHFGMSGACPPRRRVERCAACPLRGGCLPGQRITRLASRIAPAPIFP